MCGWLKGPVEFHSYVITRTYEEIMLRHSSLQLTIAQYVILCRRFKRCSVKVKLKLFRSFCVCFYDAALRSSFTATAVARNKLSSCYTKCIKSFFNYSKYSSVSYMLLELGLPSFNTVMFNCSFKFSAQFVNL